MTQRASAIFVRACLLWLFLQPAAAFARQDLDPPLTNLARRLASATPSSAPNPNPASSPSTNPTAAVHLSSPTTSSAISPPHPPDSIKSSKDNLPLGSTSRSTPATTQPAGAENSSHPKMALGDSAWWINTLIALAAVVTLIFLLKTAAARLTGGSKASTFANPLVEVLARVSVAPKNHLLFLRLGHRILVVGDSPAGMRTLANIKNPEEVANLLATISSSKPGSISAGFKSLMDSLVHDTRRSRLEDDDPHAAQDYSANRSHDQLSSLLARVRSIKKGGRQ